jgi:hypothetical protein
MRSKHSRRSLSVTHFQSILDINLFDQVKELVHAYLSKCNLIYSTSFLVGILYFAILIIQNSFPSFLIDNRKIWPAENILTKNFLYFSFLWSGIPTNPNFTRPIYSLVIIFLIIIYYGFIILRSISFSKTKLLFNVEAMIVIVISKYMIPFLFCQSLSAIPHSIFNIIQQNNVVLNSFVLIFVPVFACLFIWITVTLVNPRVILENSFFHEWTSLFLKLSLIHVSLEIVLSISSCIMNGYIKSIPLSILFLFSLFCSFFVYRHSLFISRKAALITSVFF